MRKSGVAAVAAAVMLAQLPAPEAGAATATVTQGDRIKVGESSLCTLSYVDSSRAAVPAGYTAAHCGKAGDTVYASVAGSYVPVGTFNPSRRYSSSATGNDWGLIVFNRGVALGGNPYSGDGEVSQSELQPGDRICFAGAATRGRSCGRYIGALGGNVYWENTGARAGDSGGAVWIEGRRGLLGVLSGQSIVASAAGEHVALRASTLIDSASPTAQEELALISNHFNQAQPTSHVATVPIVRTKPGSDSAAASTSESNAVVTAVSSSSQGTAVGVILAIVLGTLVASAPALAQIIEIARGWQS